VPAARQAAAHLFEKLLITAGWVRFDALRQLRGWNESEMPAVIEQVMTMARERGLWLHTDPDRGMTLGDPPPSAAV
jgi:hypothetical protein